MNYFLPAGGNQANLTCLGQPSRSLEPAVLTLRTLADCPASINSSCSLNTTALELNQTAFDLCDTKRAEITQQIDGE